MRAALWRMGVGLVLLLATPFLAWAGPEGLPPGHWAYAELEHFESRGLLKLPGTRPVSRIAVRGWVEELLALDPATLGKVERQRLAWLADEFVHGDSLPQARFDPPLASLAEGEWHFLGDLALGSGGNASSGPGDASTSWGRATIEVQLGGGEHFSYDTRYRVLLAEETGLRSGENHLSVRERVWHGLTSDNDRAVLAFEKGRVRLALGRDYVAWGASPSEALGVSEGGLSLDALQGHLRLGRFTLSTVAAQLATDTDRKYAAHRLEVRCGKVRLGFQETAVYRSVHFEPAYLFPIAFYYGNQFNERADDNVLLGTDITWVSPWAALDAELLVDDFIYDGDPAPQKIGYRLGARRAFALGGTDLDLRAGYLRLNRWTFLHRQPGVAHVAGHGDAAGGDPWLGHPLGPDADRWSLRLDWRPQVQTSVWLLQERTRRGEGNRVLTPWEPGEPYDLPFPSGDVQTELRTELGTMWRAGRRAALLGAAAFVYRPGGSTGSEIRAELRLDL